ncbi:RNA polymerase II C-terminal domain phosphatase-like 4 [Lycium barbarum]|uniref:RNA polymerase II C-terminal domain phosphatase-like 4 n=1 Tax=Lycium barbarum TaxID=112863 RepID=UPI00293EB17C|nr:RNA polymerase II C-terminal domain phosphatase-like 4 [Lycium barbarum]XP_060171793.1 RNA polymerase II C-terminal domain phosphatase-like 4 [Lycium barbarum]XP_060171794.1 RNA polymerase II C-terminal domain phosphatase-like 4 [Lycium barbarum]XP_060171795.1 RNA polymerase II C-terminal domain phosphatase-like 4 [Lycium barbarum]XP_060171796.1 RNA polymerase II C-terminal domain phosphatase-like 4 [Lycium barbarum]XP_060171797.1 RNA polymerase II C-terminal domain phosphatase-like 4 [Lyci
MSLTADSPVHSSSSDDFAAFLDAELDSASDVSPDLDEVENEEAEGEEEVEDKEEQDEDSGDGDDDDDDDDDGDTDSHRAKKRKVELIDDEVDPQSSASRGEPAETSGASLALDVCTHPGVMGGMCIRCGQKVEDESGVAFGYIHKNLRLGDDEIARLRDKDLKNLLRHKKLILVLDLDHTLLNSTRLADISAEELYLKDQREALPDALGSNLFKLDWIHMMTKLRPFVHTFLKEASSLFEMYIYTMGERPYALEMASLLDPGGIYFHSRVIAQSDSTRRHQKGLDVVLGQESAVLILDDTEVVWGKHRENLILMDRYHFFTSSCRQFGLKCKSLSERKSDENEADGALASVLKVLQRIHSLFFDPEREDNIMERDVRQVLKTVRKEILKGCKIVFTGVIPIQCQPENHHYWKLAEQLGAEISTEVDHSVTHVISVNDKTEKSRQALQQEKFLVHPRWIEAANYLWRKPPEENFPVSS